MTNTTTMIWRKSSGRCCRTCFSKLGGTNTSKLILPELTYVCTNHDKVQFLIVKNAYPEKRPHRSLPQYSEKTVIKLMDVFSMGHVCCQQYDHMVRLLIQYVATTNNENLPNGIKNLTNQIQIYSDRVKFRQIWSHCWCGK